MKNKDYLVVRLAIICVIIIIITVGILVFLVKNNSNYIGEKEFILSDQPSEPRKITTEFVNSPTMFYTVENILKEYLSATAEIENVEAIDMRLFDGQQFKQYSVYANITTKSKETTKAFYIVTLDEYNTTYTVEKVENKNSIDEIELKEITNIEKIENNGKNSYKYIRVNDAQMATNLYNNYKKMLMKSPKEAYNKLSKEYREKRFKNEQGFEEFINTNKDEISKTNISKYLVEQFDGYKDYVCQDQYGNIMTFSVKSMTEYEVKLDTYTIASNKFKEEYRKGDEFMKVKLNINKFMQMVNNQDYGTAANLLDQTFKKNNFANKNEFVEYIKSHMFRYNNISFKSVEKNGQLYVCEATFTDSTNGEYYKNSNQKVPQNYSWTFIVKLVDENSFVMSFTK